MYVHLNFLFAVVIIIMHLQCIMIVVDLKLVTFFSAIVFIGDKSNLTAQQHTTHVHA